VHVSDFLADILLNPETRADYPLDQVHETLVAFVDGSGFEGPLSRRDLWTVTAMRMTAASAAPPGHRE
jgi:hypothetical protein